ncbi:MAG: glycoside hydrolase family protein [Faecousia sp.]
MKKRIACLLLALVMLAGLIPATAIRASAAGFAVSEAGIRVIKEYVGFHKNAYETYEGSGQYKIGYGTPSVKDASITEANADKLLREELDKISSALYTAFGSVELVQKRVDALVWYSYIEGTGWAAPGNKLFEAAKANKTGSELVDAMCTWDYDTTKTFTNSDADRAVVYRRLQMANMYVSGVYSAYNTGSLTFTVFDAGEEGAKADGNHRMAVQAYSAGSVAEFSPKVMNPSNGPYKFLGWYSGSSAITGLSSSTAGVTLTAKWAAENTEVNVEYSIPAEVIYIASDNLDTAQVYIYEEASESSNKINVLNRQIAVTVVAEKMVGTDKWLKLSTGGWVKLGKLEKVPATIPTKVVTITDDYVNIRKEPDANATKLGTIKRGEQRTITMISADGKWGYCYQGWIFLAYTDFDGSTSIGSSGSSAPVTGTPGVVTGAARVNVRAAAGVGNALVTTLAEGTAVTVYEQTTVDSAVWGLIDQGWISMGYVKLQQVENTNTGDTISTGSSAVVSSSVSLNVRSGPGTTYSKVATLAPGTSVVILRKETVGGVTWGLIDQGWINLSYVTATGSSASGGSVYSVGGTVVNCSTGVNIRAAAGTNNALVGVAGVGTRVNVTEITTVNGFQWGQIDRGWVCMEYVQLDSEFKKPEPVAPTVGEDDQNNVVTSFEGYPAEVKNDGAPLRETASADAKTLLTLEKTASVNILAWSQTGENLYGKVTVGDKTGWVSMSDVTMDAFNAKVTASKADVYEEPSTRSKFYASLVNGTYITIPEGNNNWELSDSTLWGKVTVTVSGVTYTGWLKLNDVTMFRGNTMPTGVTTLSGVGYLTGSVNAEVTLQKDKNGNVTTEFTNYTLPAGSRVNILARNYQSDTNKTFGKVTVGSVTGWIPMSSVTLDSVAYSSNAEVKGFNAAADVASTSAYYTPVAKGSKITITQRQLVPDSNEINHGVIDAGFGYVGDDTSVNYWFILDDGKLTPTGKATVENPSNPVIASSVVVTGKAAADLPIYEEAIESSNILLKLSTGTNVTIVNWRNVTNGSGVTETWGKVQINKVVGWVKAAAVDFSGLTGVVAVEELKVYNTMDKASSLQILRVNNKTIGITDIQLVGTTMWGRIDVAGVNGYIDLADVKLNTPGIEVDTDYDNLPVMAKGKINSVNATVNIGGDVKSLPKSTEVSLIDLDMSSGKAMWLVELGDKDGWIDMDCLTMYSAIATITESKASIYNDLNLIEADILYTLYRDEKATVQSFYVQGGKLYGEVAYGNTTGWILICDDSNYMYVNLVPGSTGSTIGGSTGSGSVTEPTTPTTPAAEPIPAYIVCATSVNVRSGAGVQNTLLTTLANGTNVKIYEQTTVLGKEWARIDQGWVCMDYVKLGTLVNIPAGGTATNGGSGTATIMTSVPAGAIAVGYANEDIKIRSGSGLGYPEVGSVKKGYSIVIYENKLDGGMSWGRTDSGWVCTSYLTITGIGATGSGNMGTIGGVGFTANVRSSASSGGALMAKVMVTSRVVVRETTVVGTETWGRTDLGWINMQYILMDSASAPTVPDATTATTATTAPTETGVSEVG